MLRALPCFVFGRIARRLGLRGDPLVNRCICPPPNFGDIFFQRQLNILKFPLKPKQVLKLKQVFIFPLFCFIYSFVHISGCSGSYSSVALIWLKVSVSVADASFNLSIAACKLMASVALGLCSVWVMASHFATFAEPHRFRTAAPSLVVLVSFRRVWGAHLAAGSLAGYTRYFRGILPSSEKESFILLSCW